MVGGVVGGGVVGGGVVGGGVVGEGVVGGGVVGAGVVGGGVVGGIPPPPETVATLGGMELGMLGGMAICLIMKLWSSATWLSITLPVARSKWVTDDLQ